MFTREVSYSTLEFAGYIKYLAIKAQFRALFAE